MSILGAVLAIQGIAQEPPYYEQVASNIPIGPLMAAMGLLGLRPTELYLALRTTHSLVNFYELDAYASNDLLGAFSEPDDHMEYNLTFHHKSFIDFLLDPSRSGDYHVDLAKVHAHLALECLEVMNRSSFQPAPQYSEIDSDPIWTYATMHWIDHCTSSGTPRKELVDALKKFDLCFSYFDVLHRRIYSSQIHIPAAPSAAVYRGSVDITRIISPRERLLKILLVPPFRGLTSIYFWRTSKSYIRTYWREQYIPGSNNSGDHESITLLIKWLKESPNPPTKLILQYEMVCKLLERSIKKQWNDYYS
ncbi:hypothetical protein BDZ97DRAFT_1911445 [Flammula alnicola]|nr:hypothetical protein BDZ97DRAFT_1911445 [Flammula alnicola]